jgi:Ca-activated chloride channel homolog
MSTPHNVKKLLESMRDHEPPSDLLQRLEADVPAELSTATDRRPVEHPGWGRRSRLVAGLAAAAAVAIGFALTMFVLRPGPETLVARPELLRPTPAAPTPVPPLPTPAVAVTPVATEPAPLVPPPAQQADREAAPAPTAQAYARLSGTTADSQGMPLPGVTITASAPGKPMARTVVSNAEGRFTVPDLPPGDYAVRFDLDGFNAVETEVKVAAADTKQVDAAMSPAAFAETITVAAENMVIDVTKSAVATSVARYGASGREDHFLLDSADELFVLEARDAEVPDETSEVASTPATLLARSAEGREIGEFPLRHTEVKADIAGFMARTVVTQEYVNPFAEAIEAVYVFPLGAMAAVNDFVMEIGERRIVGVVRPREEAERIYREARERGQTASLLTQERPNIFTQSVANIAPGKTVTITITTFETLAHDRGTFEYVFPMVVGPRYIPGNLLPAVPRVTGGDGWAAPSTVVPDADRITPPVLKPGERSGHDIGLTVDLDAGLPIGEVRSVAHAVRIAAHGPARRTIRLTRSEAIPNRDFVLRWTVGGEAIQTGAVAYRDGGDGFVALLVQPPLDPDAALVSAREITFVLDISGSMGGVPIETSKALVRRALGNLRPSDAFNIFVFAGGNGQLWPEPRGSSAANVEEATRFLASLRGAGGTEMLAGLKHAVSGSHDPARLQMYVFCTDGYVGDEERILQFVKEGRGEARFFAFGIGSSVNRYLIDGIGKVGGGASMVVLPRDAGAAERAADRFFGMIDAPVLLDAALDWGGLPIIDAYPRRLGDLFTGGAFNVVARYSRPASGIAYLTGRLGTRQVRIPIAVDLPRRARTHAELGPVWARHRIADLSEELRGATDERAAELRDAITDLAIQFRLVSQFTSFVAVDESEVRSNGNPRRVNQPVPMPEDVSHDSVFGPTR